MSSREMGDKEKKRTVPKFSSFKPKADPEPQREAKDEKRTSERDESSRRSRHRQDDRDERKDRHERRRHDERRHGDRRESEHRHRRDDHSPARKDETQQPPKATTAEKINDLFFVDKRGDPLIFRYGSNDRSKVPSYYRDGNGRVMGSTGFLTIHRDGSKEEFTIRYGGTDRGSVFRDRNAVKFANSMGANAKFIKPDPDTSKPPATDDDFIALDSRKRKREDEPISVPEYRSIYTNKTSASDSESDRGASAAEENEADFSVVKKRTMELNRQVRAKPEDGPAWFELIDLQEALFRENRENPGRLLSVDERKGLTELKLSLYEEALEHVREPEQEEKLAEGMLREGSKVWDDGTLKKRLSRLTEGRQDSFTLWRAKLDTMLKEADCSYEGLKSFMTEMLAELGRKLPESCREENGEQTMSIASRLIYVFLRLTHFLSDVGYVELAVAAWQAVLEMTFCRPTSPLGSQEEAVALFADFWESEAQRIGEDGAKGWASWDEDDVPWPTKSEGIDHAAEENVDRTKYPSAWTRWAVVENRKSERSRMPARTLDFDAQDDPYRVVTFSDIKDLLVWFPSMVLPDVSLGLIDAFLLFCGLPTAGVSNGLIAEAKADPSLAIRNQTFDRELGQTRHETETDDAKPTLEFWQQGGDMAISQDVLFSGTWFRYLEMWRESPDGVKIPWVSSTLKYLVGVCRIEALAEYYLALVWANDSSGAKKAAKSLLKQYSSNLKLYSAYALIESANGNPDVSEKVLSAATQGLSSTSTNGQLLYNSWAWIDLESNQTQAALFHLCRSADSTLTALPSPALILKARSHFSSTRDYALSSRQLSIALQHAESLALLTYVTDSPTAAVTTITDFLLELPPAYQEPLLQTASRILYHHSVHNAHKPSAIRAHLLHFLSLFPTNTIFLSLLSYFTPTIQLVDPVRTHLYSTALTPAHDNLNARRFDILQEHRTGTRYSVRAAFEEALQSEAGRNADLWVQYIRFCAANGMGQDQVYFRAISQCPMSKAVYVEGFLRGIGVDYLVRAQELMDQRGIRQRVSLYEWIAAT